jgi:hypothetical protein
MANPRYGAIVPLGKITVSTAGTPVSLAINCGLLGGTIGAPGSGAGLAGTPLVQIVLTAPAANTLGIYIFPNGQTKTNTNSAIAFLNPGQSIALPNGLVGGGFLPENFVVDADTNGNIVYGCGFIG